MKGIFGIVGAAFVVLFMLSMFFGSWYTVPQGFIGVTTHYGAVVGTVQPGLGFKMPFVTGINEISVQPQIAQYGDKDNPMQAYSKDQQPANLQVTVNFHVIDPVAVYSGFGDIDTARARIIDPKVYEQVKNIFGGFDAQEAIQDRAHLNAKVAAAIQASVGSKSPIVVDSVQIQDIAFSQSYETAVEDRMKAQVQEAQAVALKNQRITAADAAKYEVEAAADAQAHATAVKGDAEAHAISVKGQALRDNPGVPALMYAQAAQSWDGHLPTTMVPNGTLPMLHLNSGQ